MALGRFVSQYHAFENVVVEEQQLVEFYFTEDAIRKKVVENVRDYGFFCRNMLLLAILNQNNLSSTAPLTSRIIVVRKRLFLERDEEIQEQN